MRTIAPLFAVFTALLLAGCARTSPAVGTWSGAVTVGPISQPASLTLQPDGKGFARMPLTPEQPVTWTEENGKVILRMGGEAAPKAAQNSGGSTLVGTLSEDKQAMTVDLGITQVTLRKQADAP